MTVETDLAALLEPLAPGQVYPDVAPEEAVAPYIVFQQAGGVPVAFLERALVSKKNGRFQIAVWAPKRSLAAFLSLQIESALVLATVFQAHALGEPVASYDEETQLRGSRQDFGIWSDR